MNGLTHFAAGVACQLVVFAIVYRHGKTSENKPGTSTRCARLSPAGARALAYGTTAVLAFFSHGFLDSLARYTYHDSSAQKWDNPFYGPWTYGMLAAAGVFGLAMILRDPRLAWGMMFALLPDLVDYNIIRVVDQIMLGGGSTIAFSLHAIGSWGDVFTAIDLAIVGTPISLNHDPSGAIVELAVLAGIIAGAIAIHRRSPLPEIPAGRAPPGTWRVLMFVLFATWISNDAWLGFLGDVPGGPGPVASVIISFAGAGALFVVLVAWHARRVVPAGIERRVTG